MYILETTLPDDVFISAVVPYDEQSRIRLARDLGEALHLDIRLEKRELPCRRITDPQKPYPDSWVDGANYLTAKGRLSHLPIYCVLHRIADRGSHPTQIILDLKVGDLANYRLPTLTETMTSDEILTALELPVERQTREFECIVVRARPGDHQSSTQAEPATTPESKPEERSE